jgi:hypothetical protein
LLPKIEQPLRLKGNLELVFGDDHGVAAEGVRPEDSGEQPEHLPLPVEGTGQTRLHRLGHHRSLWDGLDGEQVFLGVPELLRSLNYQLLAVGSVYPTFWWVSPAVM